MKVKKRTRFSKSVQFLAALMMAVMILSSLPFGAQAGFGGVYGLEADSLEAAMDEIVAYYEARGGQLEDWEEILNLRGAGVDLRDGSWTLPDWDSETFPVDGTAGYYGSRILALVAMEKNPEDFFDRNLIDELLAMQQEDGSFLVGTDTNINSQIYAMHALDVAGADYRVQEALEWLTGQINEDGGIGWGVDSPSDVDTTGWLVRLLAGHEAGEGVGETLSTAKAYLLEKQLESGGFASAYSGENANSTANGLLGLRATGADVEAQAALSRLYDFESGTSGFYRYLLEDAAGSTFATKQVLGAFAELHHGRTVFAALSYGWDTLDFTLRVEGAEETLLDEDFGYQTLSDEDSTVESVVAWALDEKGIDYVNAGGYFSQIGGEAAGSFGGFDGWLYRVNGEAQDSGIASTLVVEGDDILFYYGEMAPGTLYPNISTSPGVVYDGEEITFGVTTTYDIYDDDWSYVETTTAAVSGAVITLREEGTTGILEVLATDASGQAATRLDDGSYEYRVTKEAAGEVPELVRTRWIPLEVSPLVTTTVDLRIEGIDETLYHEEVAHTGYPDPTVEAVLAGTFDFDNDDDFTWTEGAYGYFINELFGETAAYADDGTWWSFLLNGEVAMTGISSTTVTEADEIILARSDAGTLMPQITVSPDPIYDGEEVTFGVTATYDIYEGGSVETTTAAVSGAAVTLREEGTTGILEVLATDETGQAATRLDDGNYEYRVTKDVAGEAPRLVRTEWLPLVVRTKAGPGGSTPVGRTDVDVAVIDASRRVLFGPEAVRLYATDEFGETAMGALDATGLSWEFQGHGFIYKINGVANEGMLGWKYAVNGVVPGVSSLDFDVDAGDRVLWWYATEAADEAAPDWPESREDSVSPVAEILEPEERIEGMKAYVESLDGERTVIGSDRRMSEEAARDLDLFLKGHTVDLEVAYDGTETLLDDGEVALLVVEGALEKEARLTVKELKESEGPAGFGIRFRSAVYDFGPDGAQFETPVVIILKLPVGDDLDPETMAPAYYDETQERWVTIPYVLDLETGQVIFEVDHFTAFALMVAPERRVFQDLDDSYDWAREAVEVLGGSGIVSGTGQGFEPGRYITRAEFVKMLLGALALEPKAANPNPFRDVATSDWAYPYLATAHAEGLLAGYPDGSLRPLEAISRFEIATLLARIDTCKEVGRMAAAFSDGMDTPVWAEEGVAHVQTHGLMKGYEDGTFRGGRRLTRAEAAVIIYRYLSLED
jgi:hypothetical protein